MKDHFTLEAVEFLPFIETVNCRFCLSKFQVPLELFDEEPHSALTSIPGIPTKFNDVSWRVKQGRR